MITDNEELFNRFQNDKSLLPDQGDWMIGKMAGSVHKNRKSWVFIYSKNKEYNAYFCFRDYGEQGAERMAKEHQIEINKKYNLSRNDYRYLDEDTVEVKLDKGNTMLIDSSTRAMELLKRGTWWTQVNFTSVYALAEPNGKLIRFHTELLGKKEGFSVDHINGTLITRTVLDNRSSNLRHATAKQQANNVCMLSSNTSGVNGVYLLKSRPHWRVQYKIDGVEKFKHFGFGPGSRRSKQDAFEAAIKFRQQQDTKNGCTNGTRPNLDLKKRKQSEEQKEERLSKRVTTTSTRTIEEYFSSSNNNSNRAEETDDEVEMIME